VKGQFLLEYGGELITEKVAEARECNDKNEKIYRYFFKLGGKSLW
jgi:SET domain-containing protein